ncbi:MAG: hypothetical protein ACRDI2_02675 [Chloroflexota bacterium]
MWRSFASLILTFVALGWATVATALCFFYTSAFWRELFGRDGAFYGAVAALVVCILVARYLLHLADKLIEPYSGPFDERAYKSAPRDTFYLNWQRYASDVVQNRRYAFYARTRQWDKLARLEAQLAASASSDGADPAEPAEAAGARAPHRTSMAGHVSPDEVYRASRRASRDSKGDERWVLLDEYE